MRGKAFHPYKFRYEGDYECYYLWIDIDEREGTSANGPDEEKNQVDEDEDVLLRQTLASAKLRALRTSREKNRRQAWENLRI
ncbi:hypothetical protein Tco_1254439 [Tanacetum coccineum]